MPERLRVLYLPKADPSIPFAPNGSDVVEAIGDRHELRIFDHHKPMPPQFEGVDVVIDLGGSVGTHAMLAAAGSARLWQVLGTGLDHFDLDYWRARGMPVANCPGPFSAAALAENAMMLILMLARQFHTGQAVLKAGRLHEPIGRELLGLKLGLIGFGASAQELARRALPFGLEISAIDIREVSAEEMRAFGVHFMGKPEDLDWVVADCDILSLHLHLTHETRAIIDARRLALMKPAAYLINVARGALVDEPALIEALSSGRLAGAGLDVFAHEPPDPASPLFSLPNVVATPHIAGMTDGTSRRRAQCAADNVDRIANGLEALYRVA
ncbi:MAG: NAD(P)-dependent oxidoreductase [Anaerolineales bacterium]